MAGIYKKLNSFVNLFDSHNGWLFYLLMLCEVEAKSSFSWAVVNNTYTKICDKSKTNQNQVWVGTK